MNKLRPKRITLTLCETLIYKPQNPKPSCAEIRSSLPRRPRQALPCAEHALMLTRRPRQALQCAELALLLTRRPRQALPCAELAFLLTRRPRQAIPCAELAFLLTRRTRQALPCAELAFLLTRRTRQAIQCARTGLPAHEATSTGHPVRQKVTFAHETDEYDGRCAGRTLSRTENHSKGRQSIGR